MAFNNNYHEKQRLKKVVEIFMKIYGNLRIQKIRFKNLRKRTKTFAKYYVTFTMFLQN